MTCVLSASVVAAQEALLLLLLLVLTASAAAQLKTRYDQHSGRVSISTSRDGREVELGYILTPSDEGLPTACSESDSDEDCFHFSRTKITVRRNERVSQCATFRQWVNSSTAVLTSCQNHSGSHIFGGLEQYRQYWPIENNVYSQYSYVTKQSDHVGVAVRYWLFSDGRFVHIPAHVPLFIDQNTNDSVDALCFIAKNQDPYPSERPLTVLEWDLCVFDDARQAHEYAVQNYLGTPTGIPDERMTTHPIWSTWARYKEDVDEMKVRQMAAEVLAYGFNNSQIEIDDNWETCYGSFTFNTTKFPDIKTLTNDLHALGFRVTLWIHPFVNRGCEPYLSEGMANGYFVNDTNGSSSTNWWNGVGHIIDFTNPEAAAWWANRLWVLRNETGIDSFKFDAGETSFLPQLPDMDPVELNPVKFTEDYVNTAAQFGPMIEVRASVRSQHVPVYFRMIDKDSAWSIDNGLKSLVTTLLQMNMVGHNFVLPDMVGGNGYKGAVPTKDLFIRWLQANVFMPTIQFSYVPWDFDQETVTISRSMAALHAQYAPRIVELMRKAVRDGSPVNPPIWWLDPTDETALATDSEFLLGEDVLVAPVLYHDDVERDIYLPRGSWRDEADPDHPVIQGPTWLYSYPAPANTLPYFTRVSAT
ncbi:myogenesis-regulating glycosidase-like [Schistocerca cancellata]|uniref:myogenesis-regulating glycosidase-like n=1 Tax=Schistocerca cancellata TaxID=274614 RepID=UPI002117B639|nr:myogenesis-regulating glycosidase-like [Schistocerca cancellata]